MESRGVCVCVSVFAVALFTQQPLAGMQGSQ